MFGDRWIAVRSGPARDTGPLPRARLRPFGNRADPGIHHRLDGEAHGHVSRAVENLKNLVADQTTEFAPRPLFDFFIFEICACGERKTVRIPDGLQRVVIPTRSCSSTCGKARAEGPLIDRATNLKAAAGEI